jgi:hypothetical protein
MAVPKSVPNRRTPKASIRGAADAIVKSAFDVLKPEVDRRRDAVEANWRRENAEAIASSNAYVAQHGLPLRRLRKF